MRNGISNNCFESWFIEGRAAFVDAAHFELIAIDSGNTVAKARKTCRRDAADIAESQDGNSRRHSR